MRPISEHIDLILRKIFSKHDKTFAEIMINWPKITGVKFGSRTVPLKISTITEKSIKLKMLHIKVSDSATGIELTYHQDIILERIAVYFGYKAVDKLLIRL